MRNNISVESQTEDEEDEVQHIDDGAGVEAVESMDESVTEPPDELVAEEMQQNEIFAAMQKNPTTSGSSSTTSSGGIAAKIHLQDAIKKGRLTPMAKQRHEMHKTMLSLIE